MTMGILDRLRGRAPRPTIQRRHHLAAPVEERTPDEQEQIDLMWEESGPTDDTIACVEGCTTTTQALRSLAASHANAGDPEGAATLEDFAARFVEHEANIV